MTLSHLAAIAEGARVDLADSARDVMAASRRVVDDAVAAGAAIYGVTTGVGHARDHRLPPEVLRAFQPLLVETHIGGVGDPLPVVRVRAGMAARLNGFARGGAGVSVHVAERLVALLDLGIHPVVPSRGSVGAGDLGLLAYVARAMLGRGRVEWQGRTLDAGEALAASGLGPIDLEPKDALAILSSNAFSIGHGALLARRIERSLMMADLVAALSMEATFANPSVVDPAVAAARGSVGQAVTSERIRAARQGSSRLEDEAVSVQDPLSFRVIPQVHGATRDVLGFMRDALDAELNGTTDNPLVDLPSGRILSNGNFHAMTLTVATEGLRIALCHVGLLAERRMGQMFDRAISTLSGGEAAFPGPQSISPRLLAGLGLRYPAAARYTRLRQLAAPTTLDVGSLDLGVEDHAPNTAEALAVAEEMVEILDDLVAIESMIATALLGLGEMGPLGRGTGPLARTLLDEMGDRTPPDATPDVVFERIRSLMESYPVET